MWSERCWRDRVTSGRAVIRTISGHRWVQCCTGLYRIAQGYAGLYRLHRAMQDCTGCTGLCRLVQVAQGYTKSGEYGILLGEFVKRGQPGGPCRNLHSQLIHMCTALTAFLGRSKCVLLMTFCANYVDVSPRTLHPRNVEVTQWELVLYIHLSVTMVNYEKPSSPYCVMQYFWWGCGEVWNWSLLGAERLGAYNFLSKVDCGSVSYKIILVSEGSPHAKVILSYE